ncbi:hypothetical protein VPH35_095536 [Triticum aestivum]
MFGDFGGVPPLWRLDARVRARRLRRLELGGRRGLGRGRGGRCSGRGWLHGGLASRLRRRLARPGVGSSVGDLYRPLAPPPRRPVAMFGEGLALSQLRSIGRLASDAHVRACLAHSAVGLISSRARCSRTESVSRTVLRERARLAPGAAGRVDGGLVAGLLGLGAGVAQGCKRCDLSARLFGWDSGRSRVRGCQGLECRGGGPGGGCAALSGGGRGLVLPGGHGRVGGMVAGGWRRWR